MGEPDSHQRERRKALRHQSRCTAQRASFSSTLTAMMPASRTLSSVSSITGSVRSRNPSETLLGVTGLVQRTDGKLKGTPFPSSPFDSSSLEIRQHGVRGEKSGFVRTAVMREFPFPVLRGERFLPESVIWYRMARLYRTRFINEVLRIRYHLACACSAYRPRANEIGPGWRTLGIPLSGAVHQRQHILSRQLRIAP